MLPNEVFALECIARYAKEGLVRDSTWEFAHCPKPRPKGQSKKKKGDRGYYLTFFDHQHQGLLQSVDVGCKCYITYKVKLYLDTMPPGHEELRVIYDKFNKQTPDTIKKISKAKSGKTLTEEHKKNIGEALIGNKNSQNGKTGALHHNSRAIIVIKPDGTRLHFDTGSEAARDLKIPHGSLCRCLKHGKLLTRGPRTGHQFFYEVKE